MATLLENRDADALVFEELASNSQLTKQSNDTLQAFTRKRLREESIVEKVFPSIPVGKEDLVQDLYEDNPTWIGEKEPGSPAAVTVPFGELPMDVDILPERFRVCFSRRVSPRYNKDVTRLRSYKLDIRQLLSDNSIKDMHEEKDRVVFGTIGAVLGAAGTVGVGQFIQNVNLSGGVTRTNWIESTKVLPSGPTSCEASSVVLNHLTVKEFQKWGRDEFGGDGSEDMLRNGFTSSSLGEKYTLYSTIKRALVPNDTMFFFATPEFMGKHLSLEPLTMVIKQELWVISFFSYLEDGLTFSNAASLARVNFA
jgi:hypothetical protein